VGRCLDAVGCGERSRAVPLEPLQLSVAEATGPTRVTVSGEMIGAGLEGGASPEVAAAFAAMWVASSVAATAGVDRERWVRFAELAFLAAKAAPEKLQAVMEELQRFEAEHAVSADVKPWGGGDAGRRG